MIDARTALARLALRAIVVLGLVTCSGRALAQSSPPPVQSVPPHLVHVVEAVYPPEALHHGDGAVVRLTIDIDASGNVTNVQVLESSGSADFDDAAVTAARNFAFEPARDGGQAVASRIRYRYRFTPPRPRPTDEDAPAPVGSTAAPSSSSSPPPPSRASSSPPPGEVEQGVTVYARTPSREINRRELTAEEILHTPGARGDALLAVQTLPGVARPPFGLGQFVIRSSPPEDTLVTLEGQPIGLPFHFGGLASTVATDLIDHVEYLPGNFSARYGRAAGGVINVTLRAPARDRIHIIADLDPIDVGVFASMPLGRNASVAIGARRSFIDLVGPLVYGLIGGSTTFQQWPVYWDGQLVLDWDIGPRDSLRVVAAASDDQLLLTLTDPNANDPNVRGQVSTHIGYYGIQQRWRHRFSDGVTHTFAPGFGYNLSSGNLGTSVNFNFRSWVFSLRDELEVRFTPHARVFVGLDAQYGYLDNAVRAPPFAGTNGIQDPIVASRLVSYSDRRTFFSPGAYAEAEIDATSTLRVLAGVRFDHAGQLQNSTNTFDPRMNVRWAMLPRVVWRAGFGQFSTPPRGYYIVPGFGNPTLTPERWFHLTAGVQIEVIPGFIDLDTDIFLKLGDQVVSPSSAMRTDASGQTVPENFANTGQGRVIGGEWMIRVHPGRRAPVYGLISYTLQQAQRTACATTCPWVTYQYDQPHILSAVLGVILPYGFEAGIRMRYTSGSVSPQVTGSVFDASNDVSLTVTDPNNPGRLPPFFSLDWRVSKRFTVGPIHAQAILEVLNTTNSANAESRIYSYDRRESRLVSGLPILPSLGIRAEY